MVPWGSPYLVEPAFPWNPLKMDAQYQPNSYTRLLAFQEEIRHSIAGFFTTPDSLDGPISRDVSRAVDRLDRRIKASIVLPSEKRPNAKMLVPPVVYVTDCGVTQDIIDDLIRRLSATGLLTRGPNYSGRYVDVDTGYYTTCDVGICAMGRAAAER